MMFVTLTDSRTGKPVYINSEYIGLIRPARSENGEITVVELVGLGTTIVKVLETTEKVIELMSKH